MLSHDYLYGTARAVIPGIPCHLMQRGIRRMAIFFSYAAYRQYPYLRASGAAVAQEAGVFLRDDGFSNRT